MDMSQNIERILYSEEELAACAKRLGAQITADYTGKENILLVSVLRGSYIFMADLSRAIDLPCLIDFMSVSSYGAGTSSSGQVEIKKDISCSIEGYHVIIVEDILDSGNTLHYLMGVLQARHRPPSASAPAGQTGAPTETYHRRLLRLPSSRCLCGGLRPRLQSTVPEPPLHRHFEGGGLQQVTPPS